MKIKVKVHSGSSQEKIEELDEENYEVWLKEKPIEDKANRALEKLLKKHFKKPVKIISGLKSRNKVVEFD